MEIDCVFNQFTLCTLPSLNTLCGKFRTLPLGELYVIFRIFGEDATNSTPERNQIREFIMVHLHGISCSSMECRVR